MVFDPEGFGRAEAVAAFAEGGSEQAVVVFTEGGSEPAA